MSRIDSGTGHDAMQVMPLYFKIFMVLEREIRTGHYPGDAPMPSEDTLAGRFDVSRVTVRHAMSLLAERNLVARQRGRGTFATPPVSARADPGSFDGLNQNIAEFEADTSVSLIETGNDVLPRWAGAEAGEAGAMRITRVRRDAIGPISYSACYLTAAAAAHIDTDGLGNRTVIGVLEAAGLRAAQIEQRLTAVAAPPEIAPHLDVAVGGPLTLMRRIMRDADDAAFEYLETYYRPDRYEYSVNLTRDSGASGPPRWTPKGG
ncbi:GntR family transcriptional regulator [Pseudohalocynthiibacter aestuariivivens]|nr:GntR family transcriptional regulator [Pseudohalocynthiibacter aestuariivivens]QIE44992.1 GntR family transcriptional regulator [Pseudohalocynthiibacter aestuariivivens]